MSWGSNEDPSQSSYDYHFASNTVSMFAASGDQSVISYPASSPNVVGVGGTTIDTTVTSNAVFRTPSGWSGSGGGCSAYSNATAAQRGYFQYLYIITSIENCLNSVFCKKITKF